MTDTLFDEIKAKVQKAALTGAMAAQSVMGVGVTPQAENIDDNPTVQPVEQTVSAQPQETTDDILYGAFDQPRESVAPANDILYDAFTEDGAGIAAPTNGDHAVSAGVPNPESQPVNLEEKYGFDLRYSPEQDMYVLTQNGVETNIALKDKDINQFDWQDQHLEKMREIFSGDTEFQVVHQDFYKTFKQAVEDQIANNLPKEDVGITKAYYNEYNTLTVIQYDIKPEDYDKCVDLLADTFGYSKEEAAERLNYQTNEDVVTQEKLVARFSQLAHEESHKEDHENNGTYQYDLHPEYMAKLSMLSEIKANAKQAGLAYDMYQATGSTEYFEKLSIDTGKLQETLLQNPDMDNPKGYIAKFVYDKWLETYNKEGSFYSNTIYDSVSPENNQDYPLYAFIKTPEAEKQFQERVSAMFENVDALGDIRQYIDPNFSLNSDLQKRLDDATNDVLKSENLKTLMSQGLSGEKRVSKGFEEYVAAVKEFDSNDGIRTPDEAASLDRILQERLRTAEPLDMTRVPKEAQAQIAALSGRNNQHSSPKPAESTRGAAFEALSSQQQGQHVHNLRLGKNMFLMSENPTQAPTLDKSKAKAPATNTNNAAQNVVLNLKMQQRQNN